MKKNLLKLFICSIAYLIFLNPVYSQTYEISLFDTEADSLVDHNPAYQSGDILSIMEDLTATRSIGSLVNGELTIYGNNLNLNGRNQIDSYSGFTIITGSILHFVDFGEVYSDLNNNTIIASSVENFTTPNNGAVFDNAGTLNIKKSVFTNNTAAQNGGVINNTGNLNIINSRFKNNTANQGAVLYNDGTSDVTITNSIFENNTALNKGGAIYNQQNKTININSSEFNENQASAGGAIYNEGTINLNGAEFNGNTATAGDGGVIYNYMADNTTIVNSRFTNNSASGRGGVIHSIMTPITITNSVFDSNSSGSSGGVISNYDTLNITDSSFSNNNAQTQGGAINNISGTVNINESSFLNNTAGTQGGAIYTNAGTINLIADNTNVEFTGNKADNVSNAIFVKGSGTLNMNAGSGQIILNDGVASELAEVTGKKININQTLTTAPTNGRVVLNNALTGFNGTNDSINLYNTGTLKLDSYTDENGNTSYGSIGSNGVRVNSFNMNDSSILDLTNGRPSDEVYINNMEINGNPSVWTDIDLVSQAGDKLNISGTITEGASSSLNFNTFKVSNDATATNTVIRVIEGSIPTNIAVADTYTNKNKYTVTNLNDGTLQFTKSYTTDGFKDALAQIGERSFSLVDNYLAYNSVSLVDGNSTLTIFGQNKQYALSGGNNYHLLSVVSGSKLNIFDTVIKETNDSNGALLNNGELKVFNSEFTYNFKSAILNNNGKADIYNTVFSSNQGTKGAAIQNYSTNYGNYANIYNSTFNNNVSLQEGGAIYNQTDINLYNNKFDSNIGGKGGAIYNIGNANIENTDFTGNTATIGGAIYNDQVVLNIKNSNFIDNIGSYSGPDTGIGGAIYANKGTINLIADNGNIEFSGNKADNVSNAIHMNNSTLNLNAGNGEIIFNDRITSENDSNIININQTGGSVPADIPYSGTIIINEDMSGFGDFNGAAGSQVNLYNGTLKLGQNGTFFENTAFTISNDSTLNLMNNKIDTLNIRNFNINDNPNIALDVDLAENKGDYISAGTVGGTGVITINKLHLLSDAKEATIDIADTNSGLADRILLHSSASKALSPIYQYDVDYNPLLGKLTFASGSGYDSFNPGILAAPVAAQIGSYLTQLNSYEEAFGNMDMVMLMPRAQRQAMKYRNLYAAAGENETNPMVFSPTFIPEEEKGLWVRPYATFETVPLKNGPSVGNVAYGTLFGGDSPIYSLNHGWDAVYTGYVGYNGSHQTYDTIGIYQNGGLLGATAAFYKGDFFTALTANVGANSGQADTAFGSDNFTMLTAGAASKTGYNWELNEGKFIIQPSFLISYTFVNTFNYTNASGVNIQSDPINAIQIAPGIKFIGNLRGGWQPYAGVTMVWNVIDKAKFQANDVALPELSVKPYIQYGVGIQRRWGERFTAFAQTMIRNAGRNGISLQFGFRWTI